MTNELRSELRRQILRDLRARGVEQGRHVPEKAFAAFGTSRGPIRAALAELANEGVLEYRSNRGYFVVDIRAGTDDADSGGEERLYRSIAADRLEGTLGETVTLNEVVRRYATSRSVTLRVFGRIEREGWAERRAGRGWTFTAIVDTPQAYREIYEVRRAIEPAGILSDGFRMDPDILQASRERQVFLLTRGVRILDSGEIFQIQSQFHEQLMDMSGNRFFVQTLQRLNSLRRLATYRQETNRQRVLAQSKQHIEIIDMLLDGDRPAAADLMTSHLGGSNRDDVTLDIFDARHARQSSPDRSAFSAVPGSGPERH